MIRIQYLTVGVACIDEVYDLAEYPEQDSKVRATSKALQRGGNAANTAVVLSGLLADKEAGVKSNRVFLCAAISDDAEGKFIEQDLLEHKVGTCGLIWRSSREESTPKSVVLRVKDTRTIVHHRNSREISPEEFNQALKAVQDSTEVDKGMSLWVHFEGRSTQDTLEMMQTVRSQAGRPCRMSLELERARTRDECQLLTTSPEVVVFSNSFVKSFGFTNFQLFIESFLLAQGYGPRDSREALWVCTVGEQGSIGAVVLQNRLLELFHVPAATVTAVTDSLGAGDAYLAGLLYSLGTLALSNREALGFATDVAAHKIQKTGF